MNILGFFIDRMQGNDVVGYITEARAGDVSDGTDRSERVVSHSDSVDQVKADLLVIHVAVSVRIRVSKRRSAPLA